MFSNNDISVVGLEIILAVITIPWVTWVTMSIYSTRQDVALSKQTLKLLIDRFLPKEDAT